MSAVRVLHVLEAIETGCARHLADLVAHATTTEHHLAIPRQRVGGHTDHAAIAACVAAGAEVHHVEMRRSVRAAANVTAIASVQRLTRRLGADVVHGHSSVGGVVARVGSLGTGARRAYTPNGIAVGRFATVVERALRPVTDAFVAVSASEGAAAVARGVVAEDRLRVIPNGVAATPPPPQSLRTLLGVEPGVPLVGSMGRLVAQKAPEILLTAWARVALDHPEPQFVLIGDGDEAARASVRAALHRPPLAGRAHWLPFLDGAAAYLGDLDVFVLTSRFEGGPYSPLEAMRAGVPVVLTDVVGSRDSIEHGRSGLLTPVDDPAATAAAIGSLLADPACRDALRTGGLARVDRFDVTGMGDAYDAVYAELTALSPRPSRRGARRQRHRP